MIVCPPARHYQHPICAALILVKDGEYPELRIKAYASRVLVTFLQHKVANLATALREQSDDNTIDPNVVLANGVLSSMCNWLLMLERANRYLSRAEADAIWNESLTFLGEKGNQHMKEATNIQHKKNLHMHLCDSGFWRPTRFWRLSINGRVSCNGLSSQNFMQLQLD